MRLRPDVAAPAPQVAAARGALTLKQLADEVVQPNSWISVRFTLVLAARLQRFRRLFYELWRETNDKLVRADAALSRQAGDDAQNETNNAIDADELDQLRTLAKRCDDVLTDTTRRLAMLAPSARVARARDRSRPPTRTTRVAEPDIMQRTSEQNLRAALLALDAFVGIDEPKRDIARVVAASLIRESVQMPEDSVNGPTLDELLAQIDLGDVDALGRAPGHELVPVGERRVRAGDKLALSHQNFLLLGNPGTGKTSLAKAITRVLWSVGLLPMRAEAADFTETTRGNLVGRVAGQTAVQTRSVFLRSLGGALFIDELYALISVDDDAFGREALDTLVPLMSRYEGMITVIGAGYEELIRRRIFRANPGVESRFPYKIVIQNYTAAELFAIVMSYVEMLNVAISAENSEAEPYTFEAGAAELLRALIAAASAPTIDLFADSNARGAINLFGRVQNAQSARVVQQAIDASRLRSPSRTILIEDVQTGFSDWIQESGRFLVVFGNEPRSKRARPLEKTILI